MASSSASPCAACKFLRRKCNPQCIFAQYFPQSEMETFKCVHRVYGASNVAKILADLSPASRQDTVFGLCFEARVVLQDPLYGCPGYIQRLRLENELLDYRILAMENELLDSTDSIIQPFQTIPSDFSNIPQEMLNNQEMDGMIYSGVESTGLPARVLQPFPHQIDDSANLLEYISPDALYNQHIDDMMIYSAEESTSYSAMVLPPCLQQIDDSVVCNNASTSSGRDDGEEADYVIPP